MSPTARMFLGEGKRFECIGTWLGILGSVILGFLIPFGQYLPTLWSDCIFGTAICLLLCGVVFLGGAGEFYRASSESAEVDL